MRQAIIYPGEDGFWIAECPSLPGCISQGETRDQAITNIREAIQGYILALQDDRLPVPEERESPPTRPGHIARDLGSDRYQC